MSLSLLNLDARWRRFNDETRACPCCGRQFSGVYDLGFDHPADWPHAERGEHPFVKQGADQLSPDLCRVGDIRLLRAILSLPIQGADESVHITPWVQVSPDVFYAYLETWDNPDAPLPAPAPALLANDLPALAETGTAVQISFPSRDARPQIDTATGALATALTNGLDFDALLDLYAACGDDIRPHLMQG